MTVPQDAVPQDAVPQDAVPHDADAQRWVDGSLESGADEVPRPAEPERAGSEQPAAAPGQEPDETGVGLGMGPPNSFEPEEDAG